MLHKLWNSKVFKGREWERGPRAEAVVLMYTNRLDAECVCCERKEAKERISTALRVPPPKHYKRATRDGVMRSRFLLPGPHKLHKDLE